MAVDSIILHLCKGEYFPPKLKVALLSYLASLVRHIIFQKVCIHCKLIVFKLSPENEKRKNSLAVPFFSLPREKEIDNAVQTVQAR